MKLQRVETDQGQRIQALSEDRWINLEQVQDLDILANEFSIAGDLATDMLAVLQLGANGWAALESRLRKLATEEDQAPHIILPFHPASFRDFMLYEQHVIDSSRGFVKRFMPGMYPLTQLVEALTGKPFGKFKPNALWYKQPIYYLSNHLNFFVSGDEVPWPAYTNALDYELELGAVLAKGLFNATAADAAAAIGGFVILNDLSARDVQKAEMDSGFGPQKAKHFASTMSSVVVTADEILPHINKLSATVEINGNECSRCHTAGMRFSIGEAIAFASREEHLHPGELFGSGTIPGGSGMETNRWLQRGDTLTLCIEKIGALSNTISAKG